MNAVVLPPDLDEFARDAVASGRFADVDAVVRAAVELLRSREQARAGLLASVLAAQEEADRLGTLSADEVAAHVRATIARRTATTA